VNGLFIDATAVQVDTCRLAALMVEPEMFQYLAEKSDPGQGREHADNPNLRAKELAADCMRRLTALHNDVDFVPQANADISMYAPDMFICISTPAERRDYGWISSAFQQIKTQMGIFLGNFNSSGQLEEDLNLCARDTKFWTRFCNRQPLWMYVYLLWDHGHEGNYAWNSILLPEAYQMDFGVDDETQEPPPPPLSYHHQLLHPHRLAGKRDVPNPKMMTH
jgi:hypothetical protein